MDYKQSVEESFFVDDHCYYIGLILISTISILVSKYLVIVFSTARHHLKLSAIKTSEMAEPTMKEMNILILGETGVGKSTWINGIVNYLSYSSLLEAENGKLLSVIPTSFSVTNDDYEEVIIRTGNDTNEEVQPGYSSTQYPKSYIFPRGDTLIRLIDTPGIGDIRGVAQDKENFKRILDHLSYVPEIHGICILLKPNNARLTVIFQFCIKELLTHLHRYASKNIVFCFTNVRTSFYKPGDTLSVLKRLLSENKDVEISISKHTVYCMDNEAFRFLAAVKNGIEFSDYDRINFSTSWDKSVEEMNRLLAHITSLHPHRTQDTISLNNARKLIVALKKPLKISGSEQAFISEAITEFATFLRQSATTPYNDGMEDYLDHLIRAEQEKVTLGNDRRVLNSLKDMKSNYTHEVNILKESISSSSSNRQESSSERVTEFIDKLSKHKEAGAQLKETIDVVTSSKRNALTYLETRLVFIQRSNK
ncbi:unnamed protein product [Allacma fusca]|uniref:G domain-containing protein n=1 Tax=Allacma fusca TaxID=39272 RepID=A0A8J2KXD1_9HEXA|nr:unnamed protein product [Allacma fusca]